MLPNLWVWCDNKGIILRHRITSEEEKNIMLGMRPLAYSAFVLPKQIVFAIVLHNSSCQQKLGKSNRPLLRVIDRRKCNAVLSILWCEPPGAGQILCSL